MIFCTNLTTWISSPLDMIPQRYFITGSDIHKTDFFVYMSKFHNWTKKNRNLWLLMDSYAQAYLRSAEVLFHIETNLDYISHFLNERSNKKYSDHNGTKTWHFKFTWHKSSYVIMYSAPNQLCCWDLCVWKSPFQDNAN